MIREYDENKDKNFILNSYLKSTRTQGLNSWRKTSEFYTSQQPAQEEYLSRSITFVDEVDDEIRGYIMGYYDYNQEVMFGMPVFVVHFAYTKRKYRRAGVSKALSQHIVSTVLSQTPKCLIQTLTLNERAKRLAEKLGWRSAGTTLIKEFK
jgi:GNAT superfamily N-acetyltransferase